MDNDKDNNVTLITGNLTGVVTFSEGPHQRLYYAVRAAYARLLSLGMYHNRVTPEGQKELAMLRSALAEASGLDEQVVEAEAHALGWKLNQGTSEVKVWGQPDTPASSTTQFFGNNAPASFASTITRAKQWQASNQLRFVMPKMSAHYRTQAPLECADEQKQERIMQQLWFDNYGLHVDKEWRDIPCVELDDIDDRFKAE